MCGITGIISNTSEVNLNNFYQAHRAIEHRGIDDEGLLFVDHKGKAIPCRVKKSFIGK